MDNWVRREGLWERVGMDGWYADIRTRVRRVVLKATLKLFFRRFRRKLCGRLAARHFEHLVVVRSLFLDRIHLPLISSSRRRR